MEFFYIDIIHIWNNNKLLYLALVKPWIKLFYVKIMDINLASGDALHVYSTDSMYKAVMN